MLAKIWNYNAWIGCTDPEMLKSYFDNALRASGFTILSELEHYFTPQGYTKLYLLCESHFAIHTFPEEEKTYIELSSCNEDMFKRCVEYMKECPNTDRAEIVAECKRVKKAIANTQSEKLKRDYSKHLRRLQKRLEGV